MTVSSRRALVALSMLALAGLGAGLGDGPAWRVAVAIGAVFAFVRPESARWRAWRPVAIWGFAAVAIGASAGRDLVELATTPNVRVWNVFHYDLGASYFEELGYHDLYVAALVADEMGANRWHEVERVRDLRTYELLPRSTLTLGYVPMQHFTPERWTDFQADIVALQPQASSRTWRGIFADRGYNPSPVWTVVGRALSTALPTTNPIALEIRCTLDWLILAGMVWALVAWIGWEVAGAVVLFAMLAPVNEGRWVGGFLQFDWLVASAVGIAALASGRRRVAGLGLAWSATTRLFPLVLVGSAAWPDVLRWVRSGRVRRRTAELLVAFGVAAGGLAAVGCFSGRGVDGWIEFLANVREHKDHHVLGERRIGLPFLFTFDPGAGSLDLSKSERAASLDEHRGLLKIASIGGLALWAAAAGRRRASDAALLGLLPLFVLAVSSRYYWALLALLPLLARPGPVGRRRWRWLGAGQATVYGVAALVALVIDDPYPRYVALNLLLALFLVALGASYVSRDLAVLSRWRRRSQA